MGGSFICIHCTHIKVKLSSLCFESFSSFIKYSVSIVFSFICRLSNYHLGGSSWLLEVLDRWWDQLGRVDGVEVVTANCSDGRC